MPPLTASWLCAGFGAFSGQVSRDPAAAAGSPLIHPPPPLSACRFALEDAAQGDYQYGMECLFRFYSYGLERAWSEPLYRDFEELTLKVGRGGAAGHCRAGRLVGRMHTCVHQ